MENIDDLLVRLDAHKNDTHKNKFLLAIAPAVEIGIKYVISLFVEDEIENFDRFQGLMILQKLENELLKKDVLRDEADQLLIAVSHVRSLPIAKSLEKRFKNFRSDVKKRETILESSDEYLVRTTEFLRKLKALEEALPT